MEAIEYMTGDKDFSTSSHVTVSWDALFGMGVGYQSL